MQVYFVKGENDRVKFIKSLPVKRKTGNSPLRKDGLIAPPPARQSAALYDEGKVRAIGVSKFYPTRKERMAGNFDVFDFVISDGDMAKIAALDTKTVSSLATTPRLWYSALQRWWMNERQSTIPARRRRTGSLPARRHAGARNGSRQETDGSGRPYWYRLSARLPAMRSVSAACPHQRMPLP